MDTLTAGIPTYFTKTPIDSELRAQCAVIHQQTRVDTFMMLGARKLMYFGVRPGNDENARKMPGFCFEASILPFNKDGKRSTKARKMNVEIVLNGLDYYDITIWYTKSHTPVQHASFSNVDVGSLNSVLRSLDSDNDRA